MQARKHDWFGTAVLITTAAGFLANYPWALWDALHGADLATLGAGAGGIINAWFFLIAADRRE